ncbi:MAG: hypothetical protein EOO71_03045 [Myxococcaceae bacterium]|nr:MAG: hypothetical protein EOO71_03045 [Myxococcaceae bacterium]
MSALKKSLLAVLALAPASAFAYPPQCDDVCPASLCTRICYLGTYRTTCAEEGYCFAPAPTQADATASVTDAKSRQAEDTEQVCGGESQTAQPSANVES